MNQRFLPYQLDRRRRMIMVQRSFTQYVKDHFAEQLFQAAEEFIQVKHEELKLFPSQEASHIELTHLEIKQVYVDNRPEQEIAFDVLLRVEVALRSVGYLDNSKESNIQWLRVSCSGEVEAGIKNFRLIEIDLYDKKKARSNRLPLTDQLVPVIYKEDLEQIAENFLSHYFPLALDSPMMISPERLAEKMGLSLEYQEITEDCSVFGQICFQDNQLSKAGTILVDPRVSEIRTVGALNNTIIHECVHWALHRKAFEFERAFQAKVFHLSTSFSPLVISKNPTTIDWMEWHAQTLTPKIMMPWKTFREEASLINERLSQEKEKLDVIEQLIDELASFFGVSRLAAKIRLVEVGYDEAIGAFNYIESDYVPTHWWKRGAITAKQTFCISSRDAATQSLVDSDFRKLLNSGQYLYVDSHFVLNLPKYLETDPFGKLTLSRYARNHMDECCLVFDVSLNSKHLVSDHPLILSCVLNRDKDSPFELTIQFHKGYENSTDQAQIDYLKQIVYENGRMYATLSNNPCDCLEKVLKWRRLSKVQLAKKIPMTERQLRRIFKGESNGSMATMVAICLALYLPPEISFHIIEKSALNFKMSDPNHQWYHFVLQTCWGKSIEEVRLFLKKNNVPL